jgi:hypothetical protein
MIKYGRSYGSVTLNELRAVYSNASNKELDKFNHICFLIIGNEQSQWQSAKDEFYPLGMTVSLARCLIMIEAGYLSFADTFEKASVFSVYSNINILLSEYKRLMKSCKKIDALYFFYLLSQRPSDQLAFFKRRVTSNSLFTCVLTRKQAHSGLKYVYGSDTDSDDEGYESDLFESDNAAGTRTVVASSSTSAR